MSLGVFIFVYIILLKICIGLLVIGLYQKNTNAIYKSKKRLDGKTAIVTGGTSGIGLEIARDFAERGAKVIVACPFQEEGLNAQKLIIKSSGNINVKFEYLDLSSFASVRKFAAKIIDSEAELHILINNAGVNTGIKPKHITEDGYDFVMQVNYFGTVLLTLLLLPLLDKTGRPEEPSRIVNTTSSFNKLGNVNITKWNEYQSPWITYRNSKLAIALFSRELASRLQNRNIIVNIVDPGYVGTKILGNVVWYGGELISYLARTFFKTPWEGAQTAIFLGVSDDAIKENGKCFYNCKVDMNQLSSLYYDNKLCQFLWENTMKAVKFKDSVAILA